MILFKSSIAIIITLVATSSAIAESFVFNGFGFGESTKTLSPITDIFNGFDRVSGDSFTGGPTAVPDNIGVLTTSPANVLAIQGARYSSGWLPTAADGSQLWTSQAMRTRKGTVQKYDSTFKGFLNEPARTNIFLNSAAPVTQNVTTTAQSYTVSVIGSGSITLTGTATGVATEASPLTVTATAGTLTCTKAGTLTHAQVEAGAFKTSPITTTGATATRAATVYSRPTAGVLRANDFGIWGRVVPSASQTLQYVFGSYSDASNTIEIRQNGSTFEFGKRIAGALTSIAVAYVVVAGAPFEYQVVQSSVSGMLVRVKQDAGAWSAWATLANASGKANAVVAASFQVGARNSTNHFAGNFPFTLILQHMDPKTQLESLAARYP